MSEAIANTWKLNKVNMVKININFINFLLLIGY